MSYYILNKYNPFIFIEGASLVYLVFLNIHIMCVDGDYLSLLGASRLHGSFGLNPVN